MTQLGLFSHSEFLLVFWLKIFYRRLLFIIALPFRKSSAEFSLMFIIIRTSTKTKVIIRRLNESACYLSFGFSTINFPSCVTGYVCDSNRLTLSCMDFTPGKCTPIQLRPMGTKSQKGIYRNIYRVHIQYSILKD